MTTWVKADSIIVYKLALDRISKNDLENFFECHPWLWLYSTCQSNQCEFDMLPRLLSTSCHSGENGRSCRRYCISFRPRMQVLCCAMYILFHSSSSCVDMDRRYSYTIVLYMKHIYSIHWRGKRVQYAFLVCESPKTYTSTRSNAQCFFFFHFLLVLIILLLVSFYDMIVQTNWYTWCISYMRLHVYRVCAAQLWNWPNRNLYVIQTHMGNYRWKFQSCTLTNVWRYRSKLEKKNPNTNILD